MGQSISALVESLENQAQKEKLANDAMNSLMELAKLQVQTFELAISSPSFNANLIPIDKVLDKDTIIQCNISNTPTDIGNVIVDTFSSFASGDVANGIGKLINSGLKLLLGNYSGNSSVRDVYVISCGSLGGISRLDMHFYSYRYTASQLTEIAKQVLCVSVVRSSVDPTKLSDSTMRNIVQNTYAGSSAEEQEKILKQLKDARDADMGQKSSTGSAAFKSGIKALNNYDFTTKTQVAEGLKYLPYSEVFSVKMEMNRAQESIEGLRAWLSSALAKAFGNDINQVTVQVEVPADSTSNSFLEGAVTVIVKRNFVNPQQVLNDELRNALHSLTINELSQIPAESYVIGLTGPNAFYNGDDSTIDATDGLNIKNGSVAEDEYPSDVEEVVSTNRGRSTNGKVQERLIDINVLTFEGPTIPIERMEHGINYIKLLKDVPKDYVDGTRLSVYPQISQSDQTYGFWGPTGSHVHFVFKEAIGGFSADRAFMVVRHVNDSGIKGNYHFPVRPRPNFERSMTEDTWNKAVNWWCDQPAPIGDEWRRVRDDDELNKKLYDQWQSLFANLWDVCNNIWFDKQPWSFDQ